MAKIRGRSSGRIVVDDIPSQRIPRIIIRSEKDIERFGDMLFPERIFERAADRDVLSGDFFDEDHPGHPSNYGDD